MREGGTGPGARGRHADAPEGYHDLVAIGTGGFATIYRARDSRFDRAVALKVLRSENLDARQLQRFRTECLATGRVSSHPNIVTVYDAGTTRGNRPWLAMEYCSGGSLAGVVGENGPLSVAEVISIGARLCSALDAAHRAGILHRDVKPGNILLTPYGEPALADFGIARVALGHDTATETAAYTVVHAAPEILEGKVASSASDIYSLGSTLYTLLTGAAPFAREASAGLAPLVGRIMANDVPVITRPGVPPALEKLLGRCLAAEPRDRPASAAELGLALADLGHRFGAGGTDQRRRAPRVRARRLLPMVGMALVVISSAVTIWVSTDRPVAPVEQRYSPRNVLAAPGRGMGELVVSWTMPTRPDVIATVVYEGTGSRARAVVSYATNPNAGPQAILRGLASGRRVCLSAAHLVLLDDVVSSAPSPPVCAVPR